ncbi:MAG: type II toxin-antitoxin system VapC family toxin [Planctomycetaceae bacterium]|jgi:PIN domain nuclease of toxin-antitoxin system|nr:type II toxin-antitoxin system VapC family toxin [Planctomycetaceae bacterium]
MERNAMIIIDTHVLIWLRSNATDRLSPSAKKVIENADIIGIPAICLWEVAMLSAKGRITLHLPFYDWFDEIFDDPRYQLIPINIAIAERSGDLSMHGDPADRLIVATALIYGTKLVSADRLIRDLGILSVIW